MKVKLRPQISSIVVANVRSTEFYKVVAVKDTANNDVLVTTAADANTVTEGS